MLSSHRPQEIVSTPAPFARARDFFVALSLAALLETFQAEEVSSSIDVL
jgi:hypothetical protein